ncbi:MAG: ArnT family glycosyltransferase [Planctomycetota bacterium]
MPPGALPIDARSGRRLSRARAAWILVLVTVIARLCVILAPPADLAPEFIVNGGWEELIRGSAARDFLRGTLMPFQDYQVNDFSGGSLVVAIVAVPFFAVLGPTVVALRLAALVFAVLGAVLVFLILDRFVSRRAAWLGGLLMALAPPGYALLSCITYGTHVENIVQGLVLVYLFLILMREKPGHVGLSFVYGLVTGFAVYFGFGILLVVALLVAFEFAHDKLFFARRAFCARVAGFAIGFAPYWIYKANHRLTETAIYNRSFLDHFFEEQARRPRGPVLRELVARDLPESVYLPSSLGVSGLTLGRAVWIVLAFLVAWIAWNHRAAIVALVRNAFRLRSDARALDPAVVFLAYVPLFVVAFVFSDFQIDDRRHWVVSYRYLMPLYPFVFLLAAIALDELAQRTNVTRAATGVLHTSLCALFFAGTLARTEPSRIRENWSTPGYYEPALGRAIAMRYQQDLATLGLVADRIVERRPPEEQDELFFLIGQNLKFWPRRAGPEGKADMENARAFLEARVPNEFKRYFERLGPDDRRYQPHEKAEYRQAYDAFVRGKS